jgi:hypothetical protein
MKTLAYILLSATVIACSIVGFTWIRAAKDAKLAAIEENAALNEVAKWQLVDRLDAHNIQGAIANDKLEIRNDELKVNIAQLEGRSTSTAENNLTIAHQQLTADELNESAHENAAVFGPRPEIVKAQTAANNAHARGQQDREKIKDDKMVSFAVLALLIASGFAFATSSNRRSSAMSTAAATGAHS